MKLISMTKFVLEQKRNDSSTNTCFFNCLTYANFLNTEITLSNLIPCDEKGIELIIDTKHREDSTSWSPDEIEQYKKAKNEIYLKTTIDLDTAKFLIKQKRKIEYFTFFDIEITDYAIKKFQLEF